MREATRRRLGTIYRITLVSIAWGALFGWLVGGWWRIVWLVMGLAPLALMATGLSTWLYRNGVRRRRRKARAGTKVLAREARCESRSAVRRNTSIDQVQTLGFVTVVATRRR